MGGRGQGVTEERITWSALDDQPGVELLWAENSGQLWRWFHETYTVCTLLSAPSEWSYRGTHHRTADGELMMMEPGEVHVTRKLLAGVSTFRVALLTADVVERAALELGRPRPHLASGHLAHPRVFAAFTRLHLAVAQHASQLEQESCLAACLQHLFGECSEQPLHVNAGTERAAVRRTKELLRAHCTEAIRLEQLATAAGLSRFHFLRAFTREVGMPPHAYAIHVRIERARALLRTGLPVAQVATTLGFADQSHLTRQFRRTVGVTPGVYQARVR